MNKPDFDLAKNYVFGRLKNELPKNLYYHGIHHTKDVLNAVEKLARLEGINENDLLILKTAALYHDSGFIVQYKNNEAIGAGMASGSLPYYGYDANQIKKINGIILATQMPQNPKTKLEELMCDADLDHLGRDDFFIIGHTLKRELEEYGNPIMLKDWYETQLTFLASHNYFTKAAKSLRQKAKAKHISAIKELLRKKL